MIYTFSDYKNVIVLGNISNLSILQLKKFLLSFQETIIIYTGDFNLNDNYNDDLDKLEKLEYTLNIQDNVLLLIRGNHDNPAYFKVKSQFRKDLSDICEHVILIPDYQIICIDYYGDNKKDRIKNNILCIGGACSLDRILHNIDFKDETVKKTKYDIQKFKDVNIIISHAAPLPAYPLELSKNMKHFDSSIINAYAMYDKHLKTDIYKSRYILKSLYDFLTENNVQIDKWIYGHYNKSNTMHYDNLDFISLALNETYKI